MTVTELMRLHVEALFTHDGKGRLIAVNEPRASPAPRFFLGRTTNGNACWFRHDVSAAVANDLHALAASQPMGLEIEINAAPFIDRLTRDAPVHKTWAGPAFCVPTLLPGAEIAVRVTPDNAGVLSPYFEDWLSDVSTCAPMVVVLESGKAVSLCASVRMTPEAHEAGVDTHRDFRGRGLAARAVAGWARAVREMNRVPLYSTSWDNASSRALAKKLGLIQFGADLHIT